MGCTRLPARRPPGGVRPQLAQKAAEMVQMRGDRCAREGGGDRGVDLRGSTGQLGQMDTKGN